MTLIPTKVDCVNVAFDCKQKQYSHGWPLETAGHHVIIVEVHCRKLLNYVYSVLEIVMLSKAASSSHIISII